MKKMLFGAILLLLAVAACAQRTAGDRQLGSGVYDSPQEQEYGGGVGGPSVSRSAHGFDRGTRTQRWGDSETRQSGPMSGFRSGEMGHGLGTQTTPPSVGGSAVGGSGQ
jgi:hypothetical protein